MRATSLAGLHGGDMMAQIPDFLFDTPVNVYWESTRACDLACKHCRAEAVPERSPDELTTEEAFQLIDDIKSLGSHLILTGGDPLKREDLFELIDYARSIRQPVAVTPTTTPLANYQALKKMKEKGVYALGISLDGATAEKQDSFRGVEGTFECSMNVLRYARELHIPVQVNSTCTLDTLEEIPRIYELLTREFYPPVRRWSVFFLIPVGRGTDLQPPRPDQLDNLYRFLYEKSAESPFHISTIEAPHFRVYTLLRLMANGVQLKDILRTGRRRGFGIRDGNGIVFVSHRGDVYPSGFLPFRAGNIRERKLSDIYSNHEIFKKLRTPSLLQGKCGGCAFRGICGGSRARAYAVFGDAMAEDPLCPFDDHVISGHILFHEPDSDTIVVQ